MASSFSKFLVLSTLPLVLFGQQGLPLTIVGGLVAPALNTIYVDPAGSDSNSGTCPSSAVLAGDLSACAYATLAKVSSTLVAYQATGFKCASAWRSAGIAPNTGQNHSLIFASVGSGCASNPLLDLSAAFVPANWVTDGLGAYSQSATTAAVPSGSGTFTVRENPNVAGGCDKFPAPTGCKMLVKVADQATCDSTAGSYFSTLATVGTTGGTATVYIHPTTGSPLSNGYTYDYSANLSGINTERNNSSGTPILKTYTEVWNVDTTMHLFNDGGKALGQLSLIVGGNHLWGGKHMVYVQNGATIKNANFGASQTWNGNIALINFDSEGVSSLPNVFSGLTIDGAGSSGGQATQFFNAHISAGSGFGSITHTGDACSHTFECYGAEFPLAVNSSSCGAAVNTCGDSTGVAYTFTALTSAATNRDFAVASGGTISCTGGCALNGAGSYVNGSGSVLTLTGAIVHSSITLASTGSVIATGNTFFPAAYITDAISLPTTSDNNTFCAPSATTPAIVNGVNQSVAVWKARTFDTSSVFGGC